MRSEIASIVNNVQTQAETALMQVERALGRAEEKKSYNALLSLNREAALKTAKKIDADIKSGKTAGRLAGVPFVAKDNFLTHHTPTTAASKMLENFVAPLQAVVIEKLEREGAICIGKANLDSFAQGGSTENSMYGPVKNAHDSSRVAGGSSGGSAVAVALDIVPFALGTDTGGSTRQPAGFNGVVGMKPTYGTISRFGVIAMASSFDCVGTITANVGDAELIMDILAGKDPKDSVTLPDFFKPLKKAPTAQKIGIIKEFSGKGVDKEVADNFKTYITKLKQAGHTVEEVSIPTLPHSLAMYYIIMPAEVMSNLARYDGVRYGLQKGTRTLEELYGQSRDIGFGAENKRRILIGSYVLSSGYFDAYYNQAQKARTLLVNDFNNAFQKFDLLISPVSPTPAFKIGEKIDDPVTMYLADVMTVAANLVGMPALCVPGGKTTSGLPIGIQLMGQQKSDALLLALAKSMEEDG